MFNVNYETGVNDGYGCFLWVLCAIIISFNLEVFLPIQLENSKNGKLLMNEEQTKNAL